MDSSTPPATNRRLGCAGSIVLVVLILALLGGFIFYRMEVATGQALHAGGDGLRELAGRTRDAFVAIAQLQPQVSVNEQVIFTQSSPVSELAVISQQTVVERETSTSWMGSTKRLRIRGVYNVKAGFDLQQPFAVHLNSEHPGKLAVQMPPAKILSIEQQKLDVLTLENGIWNHVNPGDLTDEINELNLDARAKVWHAGILGQAEKAFAEQLKAKLGPEYNLEISTIAGAPVLTGNSTPAMSPKP